MHFVQFFLMKVRGMRTLQLKKPILGFNGNSSKKLHPAWHFLCANPVVMKQGKRAAYLAANQTPTLEDVGGLHFARVAHNFAAGWADDNFSRKSKVGTTITATNAGIANTSTCNLVAKTQQEGDQLRYVQFSNGAASLGWHSYSAFVRAGVGVSKIYFETSTGGVSETFTAVVDFAGQPYKHVVEASQNYEYFVEDWGDGWWRVSIVVLIRGNSDYFCRIGFWDDTRPNPKLTPSGPETFEVCGVILNTGRVLGMYSGIQGQTSHVGSAARYVFPKSINEYTLAAEITMLQPGDFTVYFSDTQGDNANGFRLSYLDFNRIVLGVQNNRSTSANIIPAQSFAYERFKKVKIVIAYNFLENVARVYTPFGEFVGDAGTNSFPFKDIAIGVAMSSEQVVNKLFVWDKAASVDDCRALLKML